MKNNVIYVDKCEQIINLPHTDKNKKLNKF